MRLLRQGGGTMDMKKYMTFEAILETFEGEDDDTHMASYAFPKKIKCFIYGKDIFLREDSSATTISAKAYLTLEKVKPKDKLDGQVVKSVNNYPESWGIENQLYEVLTWNS